MPEPEPWTRPEFLPDWTRHPLISLDLETRDIGLNTGKGPGFAFKNHGHIAGFSACNGEKSLYFPLRHPDTDNFDIEAAYRWIKAHVQREGKTVYHNAAYDTGWIYRETEIDCTNTVDTMIMATMIDENRRSYSLDGLCRAHGIPGKDKAVLNEAARAYGLHPTQDMWQLPARYVGAYGEGDAGSTFNLHGIFAPEIEKEDLTAATQLEFDLVQVLMRMRYRGIRINHDRLTQLRDEFILKRDQQLIQMTDAFPIGRDIIIDDLMSGKKLASLFDMAGLSYPFTKQGAPSFEADWLEAQEHWFPQAVATARKYDQAADKFLTNYIEGSVVDGRIHAEIHQLRDDSGGGTKTYRLSMSNPPLQQMPANDEDIGKSIREVFEPEEGEQWIVGDYSQQEPRFTVHYSAALQVRGWEKAVKYYTDNPDADYHKMVADMTGFERRKAKVLNLSLAYGLGIPNLALRLGQSEEEAKETMDHYHEELPFVRELGKTCQSKVRQSGFIRLVDGARCRFELWRPKDDWFGPAYPWHIAEKKWPGQALARADLRKAMNRLIQGSAARQTKRAMKDCFDAGYLPLLQMHDDLNFSGFVDHVDPIEEIMLNAIKLIVPMKVDMEIGPSWGLAK